MKKTRPLSKHHLRILVLIYKFRFISIPLLQEYLQQKHPSTARRTLHILQNQQYVTSLFSKSFIIERKPAQYFLDKKGLALLKDQPSIDSRVLHTFYKNKSVTDEFRQHHLDVLAVYNSLKSSYGNSFSLFTKSEIARFHELPETKPDLYLRSSDSDKEYFLTLAHDMQPFLARRRLAEYIDHSEEEGWPSGRYPGLLFVLSTPARAQRFLSDAAAMLDSAGIPTEELSIAATTFTALREQPTTGAVWKYVGSRTVVSLTE